MLNYSFLASKLYQQNKTQKIVENHHCVIIFIVPLLLETTRKYQKFTYSMHHQSHLECYKKNFSCRFLIGAGLLVEHLFIEGQKKTTRHIQNLKIVV